MTLNLSIIKSPEGASLATMQKTFAEQGGTIGRGEGNDWVLSDPERFLSSKHCSLSFEAGQYYLTDTSTNGTFVNSAPEPLGKGGQTPVNNGDTVEIGDYQFRVELSNGLGAPAANPFGSNETPLENDPFAEDDDPFTISGRVRPDDFSDPFADTPTPSPAPSNLESDFGLGVDPMAGDLSLDADPQNVDPLAALDGIGGGQGNLGQGASLDPLSGSDPFAADPISADPVIPSDIDNFLGLNDSPSHQHPKNDFAVTGSHGETGSAIDQSFEPLEVKSDNLIPDNWDDDLLGGESPPLEAPLQEPAQQQFAQHQTPPVNPQVPPLDFDMEESTEHQSLPVEPVSRPVPPIAPPIESSPRRPSPQMGEQLLAEREPERPLPIESVSVQNVPRAAQASEHVNSAPPVSPQPAAQTPPRQEVAQAAGEALLNGMGLSDKNLSAADIEAIYASIGELMPVIVSGMIQVLSSRASIKNEFRMDITTIQPIENNPLKFSANAFEAIDTMFAKKSSAYMGPKQAFQEGFDGISEHQVAIIAGIQEGFRSMMDRFDPQLLEKQFQKQNKGVILPGMQKAKFWSSYVDYYKGFADNMDATFQNLFGDDFVEAYTDQLRRLAIERKQKQKQKLDQ